jgi:hypothetical protein
LRWTKRFRNHPGFKPERGVSLTAENLDPAILYWQPPPSLAGKHAIVDQAIHITVPGSDAPLVLAATHIAQLLAEERLDDVEGLSYHEHCGFGYRDYAEFLITIDGALEWPASRALRFRIGETLIEVGPASHLLPFLMEPYYRIHSEEQFGFEIYPTVKVISAPFERHRTLFHRALYYLNADYLRTVGTSAALHHLVDPESIWDGDEEESSDDTPFITRTRVGRRSDFHSDAPLILFNDASDRYDETMFLGFYRVLEYFFYRSLLQQLSRARHDDGVADEDLLALAKTPNEVSHLQKLLAGCVPRSRQKGLCWFAQRKGLIKGNSFGDLVAALYQFRNSVVHAKEEQIARAVVPDPFEQNAMASSWNAIIRELAMRAIRRYNTV